MRLAALLVLSTFAAIAVTGPVGAQTLSPLTGSDAITPQRTPDAVRPAPAAERPRRQRLTMQERFDAANTSHDGKLTLDQAKAANYTRVVSNFDAIDAKKNGYVTMEDIRAYNRAQRAAHRAARQQ